MKRASAMITRTMRMVHNMGAPGARCVGSVPTATGPKPHVPREIPGVEARPDMGGARADCAPPWGQRDAALLGTRPAAHPSPR